MRFAAVTCAAVDVDHATRVPNKAIYDYKEKVDYVCEDGYSHDKGTLSRTCTDLGWFGAEPTCKGTRLYHHRPRASPNTPFLYALLLVVNYPNFIWLVVGGSFGL